MKILKVLLISLGVLTVLAVSFLWYVGLFDTLKVTEQEVGPYTYIYESFVGPYAQTKPVFDKVYYELKNDGVTTVNGIGLYYDDPAKVAADQLRSDCGSILEEHDLGKIAELQKKYKVGVLPRKLSIVIEFPVKNSLSYMIGPMKGYTALVKYIETKGYKMAMPFEVYFPNKIWYVMEVVKQ